MSIPPTQPALRIRSWSAGEWQASELPWSSLLTRSGLDPLFLSWSWMRTWWACFAKVGSELHILAAYRGTELIGVAPLYRAVVRRGSLRVGSLQFIGISWRDPHGLISEYLDFIAAPVDRNAVRAAFLAHLLAEGGWSELIVGYTVAAMEWTGAFEVAPVTADCYWRVIERSTSYQADLRAGFAAYLARLGQSTRRSLWHLRRRIGAADSIRFEKVAADALAAGFADLNRLHMLRWGEVAFAGNRLRFHEELAGELARRGELLLTRLWVGGRVVSVLYDIRKGARQYNIKMAFDPGIERGFSLGLIHFGFALEAAAAEGVHIYDFLAGRGRKTDYKSHVGQLREELATVQMVKGPFLPRLYRWYDAFKKKSRA